MPALTQHFDSLALGERLRHAHGVTQTLIRGVVATACRRFPSLRERERTARVMRLIEAEAWTDAALALLELELPQWQVRRIAYDEGEWHCALSRQREMPDWLDDAVEARHADLAVALLSAFIEVQALQGPVTRPSVPAVRQAWDPLWEAMACDNLG